MGAMVPDDALVCERASSPSKLTGVVREDGKEPERRFKAPVPLEVVHQRPVEISADVGAHPLRTLDLRHVVPDVLRASGVGWTFSYAVLGDEERESITAPGLQ
jgi:hypothetical protein